MYGFIPLVYDPTVGNASFRSINLPWDNIFARAQERIDARSSFSSPYFVPVAH